jgi:hypothetical protein
MKTRRSDLRHLGGEILLSCILLPLASALLYGQEKAGQATPAPASKELVVALKEIPVWELTNERVRGSFLYGQPALVRILQKGTVLPVKWPPFTSDAPLYGEVDFPNLAPGPRPSDHFFFAVDTARKGGDYDLLYFDDNSDKDLTNDRVRRLSPQSDRLVWRDAAVKEAYFEPLALPFDFGASGGRQTLELLPRLRIYEGGQPQFSFAAARVHSGRFEIDSTTYEASVGYQYAIRGRLDEPSTTLILTPEGGEPFSWWGGDELRAVHWLGGRFWRFACTPTGEQLFVRPYEGPVGILEVGAGGRNIKNEKLWLRGSLHSKEMAVPVGDSLMNGSPQPARRCEIPVGDYYPEMMIVNLGGLRITVSNNYHTNAQGQPSARAPVRGIAIRPDKPYVLDFSNKPVVVFTEPYGATEREFAVGSEIMVKAVLVDPVLDIMVRHLNVMAHPPAGTSTDRNEQTTDPPVSLDPKVTIARATGEIVAQGIMPFG